MPTTPAPTEDVDPRLRRFRGRRAWRILALFATVLVVAATTFAGVALGNVGRDFDIQVQRLVAPFPPDAPAIARETASPTPSPATATVAQNILHLGSDTRGTVGPSIADQRGQRSDTMMLVHIPADRQNDFVMSIMRDSWLTIPGHGEAKINAAM